MNILGIETSCDETAAAVVKNGRTILSNVVASSLKEHTKYGGIIPEIASRHQLELINPIVDKACTKAHCTLKDIDAICVTKSPGLIGSLLVGLSFARALSFAIQRPLCEVDHIKAHLYANFLSLDNGKKPKANKKPKLPAIGLIVSGGHTSLYYIKNMHDYQLLGQTRDDAAGEAFDKVARILNLGYPGGPVIDKLARKGKNKTIQFKYADLPHTFDFSFSGVKTAVLYYTQQFKNKKHIPLEEIAYSFQESIVSILVKKSLEACKKKRVKTLVAGGGVAANSRLREKLTTKAKEHKINVHFPPLELCIDNAAMIAGYGYHHLT